MHNAILHDNTTKYNSSSSSINNKPDDADRNHSNHNQHDILTQPTVDKVKGKIAS